MPTTPARPRLIGAAIVLLAGAAVVVELPSSRDAAVAVGDPVIAAAGDIACDPLNSGFENGDGTPTDCRMKYTAALLAGSDAVLALGDLQYACGGYSDFLASYDKSWGQYKSITYPASGNHEYQGSGGTGCSSTAAGYYTYFGSRAGDPATGYYSYDLGAWHLVVLNTECAKVGGCGAGSPQEQWLRADLAAHSTASCTLAYWHKPRFYSGSSSGGDSTYQPLWQALYDAHSDVVLNGHQHWYERFGLQNPSGQADPNGIRQIISGMGGESFVVPNSTRAANSQVLYSGQNAFGVLKMTLHDGSYDWSFVTVTGTYSDTGTQACHNAGSSPTVSTSPTLTPPPDTTPPTTSVTCNSASCSTGWYRAAPVTARLTATDAGSGVAATYYTTDGTTPTTASPQYAGPIELGQTTTLGYFSVDVAGNPEAVRSTVVRVDAAAPSVAITSPADGSSVPRKSTVTVAVTASDAGTGSGAPSGLAGVTFYLDGSSIGSDSSAPYSLSWKPKPSLRGTHVLTAVATDVAGNTTTSAQVRVSLG